MKSLYPLVISGMVVSTVVIAIFICSEINVYYHAPGYMYDALEKAYAKKSWNPEMREFFTQDFLKACDESCGADARQILIWAAVLVVMWSVPIGLAIRKARWSRRTILIFALLAMWSVPIVLAVRIAVLPGRLVLPWLWSPLAGAPAQPPPRPTTPAGTGH